MTTNTNVNVVNKLLSFIDYQFLDSWKLHFNPNPNALSLLIEKPDVFRLSWDILSENPNVIDIMDSNLGNINWKKFCSNPKALIWLESTHNKGWLKKLNWLEKVDWYAVSKNPEALPLIEWCVANGKSDLLSWPSLACNPNATHLVIAYLSTVNQHINYVNDKYTITMISMCENTNIDAIRFIEPWLNEMDNLFGHAPGWGALSRNPSAIDLLSRNISKIHWKTLFKNPNPMAVDLFIANLHDADAFDVVYLLSSAQCDSAIDYLEQHPELIHWPLLSENPKAIRLMIRYYENIVWETASANPMAITLLWRNYDKIYWKHASKNPNAIHLIEHHIMEKKKLNKPVKLCPYYLALNPRIFTDGRYFKDILIMRIDLIVKEAFHPTRMSLYVKGGGAIDQRLKTTKRLNQEGITDINKINEIIEIRAIIDEIINNVIDPNVSAPSWFDVIESF